MASGGKQNSLEAAETEPIEPSPQSLTSSTSEAPTVPHPSPAARTEAKRNDQPDCKSGTSTEEWVS